MMHSGLYFLDQVFSKAACRFLFGKIFAFFIMVGFLFLTSCSFDEPVLPTWTVNVNVPLSGEVFRLGEELINDSTITAQGADSLLFLSLEGNLDTMELSATDFATGELDTTHNFTLGDISLDSLNILSTGPVSLGTIFPDLRNLIIPGFDLPVTIPDTTLYPPPEPLETQDFVGLKIKSGTLRIKFRNNLPLPLGPNNDYPNGITVTVRDSTQQQVIQLTFNEIVYPGQQIERVSTIGGSNGWIYSPLEVEYAIPIAQQTTFILNQTVLDTSNVTIDVLLENVTVSEAIAKIPQQKISESMTFQLDGDNQVKEAAIDRGRIRLNFQNNTELNTKIVFTLPNFTTVRNKIFTDSVQIDQNSSLTHEIVLDNMHIGPPIEPAGFIDSMKINYTATTEKSNGNIHIRSTDNVLVHINVDSIYFKSFTGFISPDTFQIEPFEEDSLVDYNNISPNIRLTDVNLDLSIANEVYIENMFVDLDITGYSRNESGLVTDSASISIRDQQINPGLPGNPVTSYISLSGQQVADFLNILPTCLKSSGKIKTSGNVEISRKSRFSGGYKFTVPMRFRIEGDAVLDGNVEILREKDIDKKLRNAADKNLEEASLTLKLKNGTPLGGSLMLIVSGDSAHQDIYDIDHLNPELEFVKQINIQPAPTDPQTGFVSQPLVNEITLSLNHDEIRLFKKPPLRVGYRIRIAGTGGTVALRSSDFIEVSGLASVITNINND